jgi:hypothetical protein
MDIAARPSVADCRVMTSCRNRASSLTPLLFLLALTSDTADASQGERGVWEAVADINASASEVPEKASAIKVLFDKSIRSRLRHLDEENDESLHEIFRSLQTAYFYARTGDYAHRETYKSATADTLAELHRRGAQQSEEVDSYYDSLVVAREFEAVRKLKKVYAGFSFRDYQRFDSFRDINRTEPAAFIAVDEGHLHLSGVELPKDGGYAVVVIGCHFARDAARAIAKNPRLAEVMAGGRVLWVFSDLELTQQSLNDWNKEFPSFKAMIAYDNASWGGIDFSATPSFHFFRDGKLLEAQIGWDGLASEASLARSLEAIGLLAAGRGAVRANKQRSLDRGVLK